MTSVSPSVEESRFRGEPSMVLRAGPLSATFLPSLGMTGASLRHGAREHVAMPGGLDALRAGSTTGIPLLAPWANRLSSRRYRAAGIDVDLTGRSLTEDDNGLPIHGLLVGRPGWTVESGSVRRGVPGFAASIPVDDPAFPFPHRIEVQVGLLDDRLTIETSVLPTGERPVPIAFGWHPYLRLEGAPRASWRLRLPAMTHLTLDDRGIPDGGSAATAPEADLIGGRTFDDLYRLGEERELSLATDAGEAVTLVCEAGFPNAQVWVPPDRPFAALEPMVAPTNSLVEGSSLLVQPGEAYRSRFSLIVGSA
jgi:aldose 1-epimerase